MNSIGFQPFQDLRYAASYAVDTRGGDGAGIPLLLRDIPGTGLRDGQLPWPYVRVAQGSLAGLGELAAGLVSLVGVVLPVAAGDAAPSVDLVPFKSHFVFRHDLPPRALGARSLENLRAGARRWRWRAARGPADWQAFVALYRQLVARRRLAGGFFDFAPSHFAKLAELPFITLHGVHDGTEWGSMVCAAEGGGEIHFLHIVNSAEGLRTSASYVLMDAVLAAARLRGMDIYLGSTPAGDSGGVARFKTRWSNSTQPSQLLRMVIDPVAYARLAVDGNPFFPAYRRGP